MLIEKLEFENGLTIALWEMTESVDELLERLELDPFIMEKVFSFSSEKRRLEYLAVRVMLNEVCGSKKTIAYLPSGMPYLSDNSAQISITHTGKYAAIILHPISPVGIDIERITDKVARVRTKFLSEEELSFIDMRTEKTHLAIMWAAKETLYKIIGVETVNFINDLHLEPFQPYMEGEINATESCTKNRASYSLSYKVYPQFVMVWVKK
jgi:phosphopantetheinyl transferase